MLIRDPGVLRLHGNCPCHMTMEGVEQADFEDDLQRSPAHTTTGSGIISRMLGQSCKSLPRGFEGHGNQQARGDVSEGLRVDSGPTLGVLAS